MKDEIRTVKVANVQDHIQAEMMMNLLHNNGIESYKKEQGAGDYLNVYMGYSVFGAELYVNEKDEENAREILRDILDASEVDPKETDTKETDIYAGVPFYKNKVMMVRIFLIVIVVMWIVLWMIMKVA